MSEKKLSIQQSIIWNSVGSIFYLGCQWLITVLVVRLSGVEEAGILSLAMSVSNIWYCFAVYGMRNYQVSDTQNKYNDGTYIISRIVTGLASLAGCLVYIMLIPYDAYQRWCMIIYFIYRLTEAWFDVYAGIFQKNWRLDLVGKSMMIRGGLTLVGFTAVLAITQNMLITFGIMAFLCTASVILYDVFTANKLFKIDIKSTKEKVLKLLAECSPLVVYTFLSSAIGTIPRIFMERLLGNYELGIYGSVATPTLIIQMGATYIFNPFVTLFAEKYYAKEKKAFVQALMKCTCAVAAIAVIGVIGGKILGVWGLNLLYGAEVAEYHQLLIPLILCTVLTAFAWLLCGVLTAVREFKGLVIANAGAVIASGLLSYPCEIAFGMQGASLALALATIVEILLLAYFLWKNMRQQFNIDIIKKGDNAA